MLFAFQISEFRYYEGVIKSFSSFNKKHKVSCLSLHEYIVFAFLLAQVFILWFSSNHAQHVNTVICGLFSIQVLYSDGEVEHLVLKKERWEVINHDAVECRSPISNNDIKTREGGVGKATQQKLAVRAKNSKVIACSIVLPNYSSNSVVYI